MSLNDVNQPYVIENTQAGRDEFGHAWGSGDTELMPEHLEALQNGKCIAIFDGEYVHFLVLGQPGESDPDDSD